MENIRSLVLPDYGKYEERLRSFNEKPWPNDSVMYIKDLVEAGFVYTGEIDLVFCFKCGITESNWLNDENPRDRHTSSNQFCPFLAKVIEQEALVNQTAVINNNKSLKSLQDFERQDLLYDWVQGRGIVQRKPLSVSLPTADSTHSNGLTLLQNDQNSIESIEEKLEEISINLRLANENMRYELKRFQSFSLSKPNKHWPNADKLSSAGFYFVDEKIGMKCFCCDVNVVGWESSDQCPLTKHKSLSKICRFAHGSFCGNIPVGQESVRVDVPIVQSESLDKESTSPERPRETPSEKLKELSPTSGNLDESVLYSNSNNHHETNHNRTQPTKHFNNSMNSFCQICEDNPVTITLVPCGHTAVCESCSLGLLVCPMCREGIERPIRTSFVEQKQDFPHSYYQPPLPGLPPKDTNHHFNPLPMRREMVIPNRHLPPMTNPQFDYNNLHPMNMAQPQDIRCNTNGLSKYYDESIRFKTFFTWPRDAEVQPVALVKAGFFYTEKNDIVQCCMCGLVVSDWRRNDDPLQIHLTRRSNCPFLHKNLQQVPKTITDGPDRITRNHQHRQQYISPFTVQQQEYLAYGNQPTVKNLYVVNTNAGGGGVRSQQQKTVDLSYPYSPHYQQNRHQHQRPSYEEHHSANMNYSSGRFNNTTNFTSQKNQSYGNITASSHKLKQCSTVTRDDKSYGDVSGRSVMDTNQQQHQHLYPQNADEIREIHRQNRERAQRAYKEEQINGTGKSKNSMNSFCKICEDNPVTITFVPCGHLVVCESCALGLLMCPMCRKGIRKTIRTFFYGN